MCENSNSRLLVCVDRGGRCTAGNRSTFQSITPSTASAYI